MTDEKEVKSKFAGVPCSEESLKEWQKSFTDIEESIEGLNDEMER